MRRHKKGKEECWREMEGGMGVESEGRGWGGLSSGDDSSWNEKALCA